MRKILLTLVAIITGICCAPLNAQESPVQFGIKAGLNLSKFSGDFSRASTQPGYYVGATVDYNFARDWFLQSGVDFTVKGSKRNAKAEYEWSNTKTSANPMYIQVPIHVGYKIQNASPWVVSLSGGPYVAYGIAGKFKSTNYNANEPVTRKTNVFSNIETNRFDMGLGLKLAVEYDKFGFHMGYDVGLLNMARKYSQHYMELTNSPTTKSPKVRNRNFFMGLGYKF